MKLEWQRWFADLSRTGTGWLMGYAIGGVGMALGALLGWVLHQVRLGLTFGFLAGILIWLAMTITARRRLNIYKRRHVIHDSSQ